MDCRIFHDSMNRIELAVRWTNQQESSPETRNLLERCKVYFQNVQTPKQGLLGGWFTLNPLLHLLVPVHVSQGGLCDVYKKSHAVWLCVRVLHPGTGRGPVSLPDPARPVGTEKNSGPDGGSTICPSHTASWDMLNWTESWWTGPAGPVGTAT